MESAIKGIIVFYLQTAAMNRHLPPAYRLRAHLKRGGLIAYPTESCYGLGCLPTHRKAVKSLIKLKKRPQTKGLIVIGDTLSRLQPLLAPLNAADSRALGQIWPARKTFLLSAGRHVLPELRGKGRRKLAVRIPDHGQARALCRAAASPLVSTSCNRAKQRPCTGRREVFRRFGRDVLLIGGRCGGAKTPSSITDWASGSRLR